MRFFSYAALVLCLSACGTKYDMPQLSQQDLASAQQILAEEGSKDDLHEIVSRDPEIMLANFFEVVERVEPVAEQFCVEQMVAEEGFDCDVTVVIDDDIEALPNAYQFFDDAGRPMVMFNLPFIAQARNQDELAFVFGHEVGHLIGDHIDKQQQQEIAGAVLMTTLAVVVQGASGTYDPGLIDAAMDTGGAIGRMSFSQTYELEADMIGAYIAERAGYDPALGVRIFARRESAENEDGTLSFWGTHPPSPERVGTVLVTLNSIERQRGLGATPAPR